jgi:hypothetical protein
MDKRYSHQSWVNPRYVKPWYFLLIAVVCGSVCVVALRQNNLQMADLRNQVYAADKNNGNVVKALQNLQVYVTSNMNTDLSSGPNAPYPPIQLQYTYERAVEAAGTAASAANSQLYTNAENYCQQLDPTDFSGHNRVPCVEQYVENHGASLPSIPVSLYEFDFVSPQWTPDLAGWTLLATAASAVTFVGVWLYQRLTRHWPD